MKKLIFSVVFVIVSTCIFSQEDSSLLYTKRDIHENDLTEIPFKGKTVRTISKSKGEKAIANEKRVIYTDTQQFEQQRKELEAIDPKDEFKSN